MNFTLKRDQLLKGLQFVTGVVERRQSLPILSHVLLRANHDTLSLTGSDLEIELTAHAQLLQNDQPFETTVSARKLMDICRTLPEDCDIVFQLDGDKALVKAGKSRFSLVTLPSADFPLAKIDETCVDIALLQENLVSLLESTSFSMAQQDVRYYLNGLLMEFAQGEFSAVATDGHRLALYRFAFSDVTDPLQFILPRKGVVELLRVLSKESGATIAMHVGKNALHLESDAFTFVSRLIDGKFPDYRRFIPQGGNKQAIIDRDLLKQSLQRAAILTNEKHHAVKLHFSPGCLFISAVNTHQEEASEEIRLDYTGEVLEMSFNVNYLLDVLSAVPQGNVIITLLSSEHSVLIHCEAVPFAQFVIMPMSV